jgi:uroporphyrinogen decarboxylase
MTPKQVVLKAFDGGKPDRIPVALMGGGMWGAYHYETTLKDLSTDPAKMTDMIVSMAHKLQSDIVYVGSGYPNVLAAALGGKLKFSQVGAVDLEAPIMSSEQELQKIDISKIHTNEIIRITKKALKMTKSSIGEEYLVTLTADFATRVLIHFYEPVVADGDLDVILLGDPTASGDLISKKHFETIALPYLKKFIQWARSKGIQTFLHICGDTTDRLDLYPLTGASCISLDHKTDIAKAKEVLHGQMCFAGNIDPVEIMLQGSVRDVEEACKRTIEIAGTDGGFVLMPGCDIPPTIPYENIQKFIQIARDWKL